MITKAIISVAGWGTRRLPITKSIEKCMLPVGNRPLVDYVVQDCISAGITDIYFIIAEGSTQLKQYYSDNDTLNQYLIESGKNEAFKLIALPEGVTFHYIEQPQAGKYGTAIPVALAARYIVDEESAVVVGGDDFIYNADGSSEIKRLLDATPEGGNSMLAVNVPKEQVANYGVIEINEDHEFVQIVEKPAPEYTPSTLINISKYVLNHDALMAIVDFASSEQTGEYYITDPINHYVTGGGSLKVVEAQGEYLDGGSTAGWLHANRVVLGD
ncbi:MAG: putative UTP--glucose-phosphate uridylyltransferase [Candidatus Saccharibacteria bacterium]|nr:putative UTP--glucose-phosphate uridylyltransferase [Candidatus Saccharibacteria bacterium]